MKHITARKRLFWIGLAACSIGGSLIWVGDGNETMIAKGLVLSGLAICISGIIALRYLLFAKKAPGTLRNS
jgi:hypothetical protein